MARFSRSELGPDSVAGNRNLNCVEPDDDLDSMGGCPTAGRCDRSDQTDCPGQSAGDPNRSETEEKRRNHRPRIRADCIASLRSPKKLKSRDGLNNLIAIRPYPRGKISCHQRKAAVRKQQRRLSITSESMQSALSWEPSLLWLELQFPLLQHNTKSPCTNDPSICSHHSCS